MAQSLGVSRPVVREAMIALELLGLVEVRTGSGIYVTARQADPAVFMQDGTDPGPSPFELIDARRVIEGETAAIAAERIDDAGVNGLREAIDKMERDIEAGEQRVSNREDGDSLFHSRIAAAADNAVLQSIVEQLWDGMRRPLFAAICKRVGLPENARRAVGEHREILRRIAAHDPEGARKAMWAHIDQVRSVMLYNGDK